MDFGQAALREPFLLLSDFEVALLNGIGQDVYDEFGASSGRVTFWIVDGHFHAYTLSRPDSPFKQACQFSWRHSAWIG